MLHSLFFNTKNVKNELKHIRNVARLCRDKMDVRKIKTKFFCFFWKIQARTTSGDEKLNIAMFQACRSVSSHHDTFSTRPSHRYVPAAPKPMSHFVRLQYYCEHLAGSSCVNLSGVCADNRALGFALHPSCKGFGLAFLTYGYHRIFRLVFRVARPTTERERTVHWSFFCQSGFDCYFCVQVWTEQSGWRL